MSEDVQQDPAGGEGPGGEGAGVESLPGGARAALEAVLMVLDQPATDIELATAVDLPVAQVSALLHELQEDYDGGGSSGGAPRGFELRKLAGGWRIFSRSDFADIVSGFVLEGQTARLTQAALETLAVIAYRQPVARSRVSAIRGVNVDSVVRTLVQRGLIEDSGIDPETGAVLYRTTSYFLERLGIGSLSELPELAPHLPGLEHLADIDESVY
jgi:segregation and condensation protein B